MNGPDPFPIELSRVGEDSVLLGPRILVDRFWPRGLRRDAADFAEWLPQAATSTELRLFYGHDPLRQVEFLRRYGQELRGR